MFKLDESNRLVVLQFEPMHGENSDWLAKQASMSDLLKIWSSGCEYFVQHQLNVRPSAVAREVGQEKLEYTSDFIAFRSRT